jgi:hypothetical protein
MTLWAVSDTAPVRRLRRDPGGREPIMALPEWCDEAALAMGSGCQRPAILDGGASNAPEGGPAFAGQ